MKRLVLLLLALGACGDNVPPLPECPASVVAETCVDHADVAFCLVGSDKVAGCIVPAGIDRGAECVAACPPNRYDSDGGTP